MITPVATPVVRSYHNKVYVATRQFASLSIAIFLAYILFYEICLCPVTFHAGAFIPEKSGRSIKTLILHVNFYIKSAHKSHIDRHACVPVDGGLEDSSRMNVPQNFIKHSTLPLHIVLVIA
jgi:hypothetical protein